MTIFKIILRKALPHPVMNFLRQARSLLPWDQWATRSWAQEGEDLILNRMLERKHVGFYVDVGAHHPKRFSNTYLFYRRGWSGINIDAMPGSMHSFRKWRRRDINLEIGIDLEPSFLEYFIFNEPALNGFDANLAMERHNSDSSYSITEVAKVEVKPLSEVLATHAVGGSIDFLTVDVEGLDLRVLMSNDWEKYRPKIVLAEVLASDLYDLQEDKLVAFMTGKDYTISAKTANSVFFLDTRSANK